MKYRVWWWRQILNRRKMEFKEVKSVEEAKEVLKQLASKDLKNKDVIANGGGLEIFEDGAWGEYYDDLGRDIWEIIEEEDEEEVNV